MLLKTLYLVGLEHGDIMSRSKNTQQGPGERNLQKNVISCVDSKTKRIFFIIQTG